MEATHELRKKDSTSATSATTVVPTIKRKHIGRNEFLSLVRSWTLPPKPFYSPEANEMQLHEIFLNLYMPRVGSRAAINTIFIAAPSSRALSSAIKSVCLLLVYQESDDRRLVHAAGPEYSIALRQTRQELCRSERSISAVVGTNTDEYKSLL